MSMTLMSMTLLLMTLVSMTRITLTEANSTARASVTGVATRLVKVTGRVPELRMRRSIVRGPESEGTRPKFNIS